MKILGKKDCLGYLVMTEPIPWPGAWSTLIGQASVEGSPILGVP